MTEIEVKGISLIDAVMLAKFAPSKTQARKLIQSGGIRVEDQKITDPECLLFFDKEWKKLYIATKEIQS